MAPIQQSCGPNNSFYHCFELEAKERLTGELTTTITQAIRETIKCHRIILISIDNANDGYNQKYKSSQ